MINWSAGADQPETPIALSRLRFGSSFTYKSPLNRAETVNTIDLVGDDKCRFGHRRGGGEIV